MAIAVDATNTGFTASSATHTESHTTTGSDLLMVVSVLSTVSAATGVTYNGVALTQQGTEITMDNGYKLSMWYKLSPATGTHDVVATVGGATGNVFVNVATYTGVSQSGFPDASAQTDHDNVANPSTSVTVVTEGCWTIMADGNMGSNPIAGNATNTRIRDGVVSAIFDSGMPLSAGSHSLQSQHAGTSDTAQIMISVAPSTAHSGIAYDNGTYAQATTGTSLTFSHTTAGSDRLLLVMGHDKQGTTVVTGITYNSVAMTKAVTKANAAGENDRSITLWYLIAPASGANNVVVTASESVSLRFHALSFINVHQTVFTDGTDTSPDSTGTISTDITTTIDNDWMVMFAKDDSGSVTYSSTTGDGMLLTLDAGGHAIAVTGAPITPAGANTMTLSQSSAQNAGAVAFAFAPTSAAATLVKDIIGGYIPHAR